jgi:hypothetical protein
MLDVRNETLQHLGARAKGHDNIRETMCLRYTYVYAYIIAAIRGRKEGGMMGRRYEVSN